MLTVQGDVTPAMIIHEYAGSGTEDDPYRATFLLKDPEDPMQFSPWRRWMLCLVAAYVTFSVAFISSAYTSAEQGIFKDIAGGTSIELVTLGLSVFLLGFVLGPFIWAPTSELFGRRIILILSTLMHVIFNIVICFCQSLPPLLVLRFLSGAFGAAPLTNSGGIIADIFPPKQRGLAITVYALVPLFAPVLGPIIGEFVVGTLGWRWLMGIMALLSASALVLSLLFLPETYAPVLLRKRAQILASMTGKVYVSAIVGKNENGGKPLNFVRALAGALSRPFLLAINEPIIIIMALYQAVVFGTLYLTFAAFPMVYTGIRGWPKKKSGLSFLGVLVGILFSVVFQLWDNFRYVRLVNRLGTAAAPPETRLLGCFIGGISIVFGLFLFALTANPKIYWMINTAAGIPFGFGMILVTVGSTNYLVDSYTVFAASALTICIVARAICGALFPLFVRSLFATLGVYWALAIPGFLTLVFVPFPFALYRYGPRIRARCKYAGKAEKALQEARLSTAERTPLLSGQNNLT